MATENNNQQSRINNPVNDGLEGFVTPEGFENIRLTLAKLITNLKEIIPPELPSDSRAKILPQLFLATSLVAGCASVPRGNQAENEGHGPIGFPPFSDSIEYNNDADRVEWIVENLLDIAFANAGPPGIIAKNALWLAKEYHNGNKAEEAMDQLIASLGTEYGSIIHEGTEHNAEYSVEKIEKDDSRYQEITLDNADPADMWKEPSTYKDITLQERLQQNPLNLPAETIGHLTTSARGRYADALLSEAKKLGRIVFQPNNTEKIYVITHVRNLPIPNSYPFGGD
jgi:hypothetical protein